MIDAARSNRERRATAGARARDILPPVDAPDTAYTDLDARWRREGYPHDRDVLVAVLSELWRRCDALTDADDTELQRLATRLQNDLLHAEQNEQRALVREFEANSPTAARVLRALSTGPTTPSALATQLGVPNETVSRSLAELRKLGAIVFTKDVHDGRRRVYQLAESYAGDGERGADDLPHELTAAGAATRMQVLAHGNAPARDHEHEQRELEQYVNDAIDEAVLHRRRGLVPQETLERLRSLVNTCETARLHHLEVRARRELATGLRQARRTKAHLAELNRLRVIAAGKRDDLPSELTTPAFGHLFYELGKIARGSGTETPKEAVRCLTTSAQIFEQMQAIDPRSEWRRSCAWSIFALGNAYRQRTELERALAAAERSADAFHDLNDTYGLAASLHLAGFCFRLRGEFKTAEAVLARSQALSSEHEYSRLRLETGIQLAETRRSLARLDEAAAMLEDLVATSEFLEHDTCRAFALSSRGAVAYAADDQASAKADFDEAHGLFVGVKHQLGLAVNQRRRALAASELDHESHSGTGSPLRELGNAKRRFSTLESPAGVLGCLITQAEVMSRAQRRKDEVTHAVDAIVTSLEGRPDDASLVARDPWIPSLLVSLATHSQSESLGLLAHRIQIAQSHVLKPTSPQLKFISEFAGVPTQPQAIPVEADPMAGEPRRQAPTEELPSPFAGVES